MEKSSGYFGANFKDHWLELWCIFAAEMFKIKGSMNFAKVPLSKGRKSDFFFPDIEQFLDKVIVDSCVLYRFLFCMMCTKIEAFGGPIKTHFHHCCFLEISLSFFDKYLSDTF